MKTNSDETIVINSSKPKKITPEEINKIFSDIRSNKQILFAFIKREFVGKYKKSKISFWWQFLMPLITVGLFYIVFTGPFNNNIPNYAIYLCAGMFPFMFLQTCLNASPTYINKYGEYIKKIYFPREIIPLAEVTSNAISFIIEMIFVISIASIISRDISLIGIFASIFCIFLCFIFALGLSLLLSSVSLQFPDVPYIINALSRVLFWISPIFYLYENTNGVLRIILDINPFTYFIECFHYTIYYNQMPPLSLLLICTIASVLILIIGGSIFIKNKDRFVEKL